MRPKPNELLEGNNYTNPNRSAGNMTACRRSENTSQGFRRISFHALCFHQQREFALKFSLGWAILKRFSYRNWALIMAAPGDLKKLHKVFFGLYLPGCLIFAFPTHPRYRVEFDYDACAFSPRLAGGEVCKERRGEGGTGTIRRSFIASHKLFFLHRLCIFQ